jgi:transposase-like protein
MGRKRYSPEQIVTLLREAEVLLSKGSTVGAVCREIGISEHAYYRWRRDYGGLNVNQARRLTETAGRVTADPAHRGGPPSDRAIGSSPNSWTRRARTRQ